MINGGEWGTYYGWSAEAIQRFNKLFNTVKKDRKANKTFINTWLAERKAKSMNATEGRKRKLPNHKQELNC
jgi:hypothetical protein